MYKRSTGYGNRSVVGSVVGGDLVPDAFQAFDQHPPELQELIISALEYRATLAEPRATLESYLAEIVFPPNAEVLEVGCGSGPITRALARWPGVRLAVGIDPWESFITEARARSGDIAKLSFQQGDGHALPFDDQSFDVIVLHTTLSHMRDPVTALAEAHRVLRVGGTLSVCEPDPYVRPFAVAAHDPLQTAYEAGIDAAYERPWVARQLPRLVQAAGFKAGRVRSYGGNSTEATEYGLLSFGGSVDTLARSGIVGEEFAMALKTEARRRANEGTFLFFNSWVSMIAYRESG